MQRRRLMMATALGGLGLGSPALRAADEGLAVIAHPGVKGLDLEGLKRLYTGRMVELDGLPLRPLNLPAGTALRQRFLRAVLQQDDDDYIAYWTVRRHIGKGVPPRELRSSAEVLELVARTPGAVGYVETAELRPGVSVLLRR